MSSEFQFVDDIIKNKTLVFLLGFFFLCISVLKRRFITLLSVWDELLSHTEELLRSFTNECLFYLKLHQKLKFQENGAIAIIWSKIKIVYIRLIIVATFFEWNMYNFHFMLLFNKHALKLRSFDAFILYLHVGKRKYSDDFFS